jgi:transposase InsO family protein
MLKGKPTMPWPAKNTLSLRREFVQLALQGEVNRRELCRRFEISPRIGYKWLRRYGLLGEAGLIDQSRCPHQSPQRTNREIETTVIDLRRTHPAWGGRKLRRRLMDLGYMDLPAPSTITDILHRHRLIAEDERRLTSRLRFEHGEPNSLWQIDFKGYFDTPGGRCHPLTALDDHSRFNLILTACARQNTDTVRTALTRAFLRYGLPVRINADNGAPWGSSSQPEHGITQLTVWLIRMGVRVSHSRPAHPQTNGKEERFHRSLKAEVLNGRSFNDLHHVQKALDQWRTVYNHERPHEALNLATPVTRYRPSPRSLPDQLPPIEYGPDDVVTVVGWDGKVCFAGHKLKVSNALHRLPIAFRPVPDVDGLYDLYFCHQRFTQFDLRQPQQPA